MSCEPGRPNQSNPTVYRVRDRPMAPTTVIQNRILALACMILIAIITPFVWLKER
jgi:hypothetical protein